MQEREIHFLARNVIVEPYFYAKSIPARPQFFSGVLDDDDHELVDRWCMAKKKWLELNKDQHWKFRTLFPMEQTISFRGLIITLRKSLFISSSWSRRSLQSEDGFGNRRSWKKNSTLWSPLFWKSRAATSIARDVKGIHSIPTSVHTPYSYHVCMWQMCVILEIIIIIIRDILFHLE